MEILNAMEDGLEGRFIPVKIEKEALVSSSVSLKTLDEFGELLSDIENTITEIGTKMKMGNASAVPMKNKIADACKYCKMYPVCRNKK